MEGNRVRGPCFMAKQDWAHGKHGRSVSYQGRLLWLWGAWRAIGGGRTALITGIGHVPICQGLERRQTVFVHWDTVQGFCEHCQQVGLIFLIYLLKGGEKKRGKREKKTF